jgi:predicted alpha/beta-hydrolase family hydrolase
MQSAPMPRELSVSVGDARTTARVFAAEAPRARLLLAHGAGADQRHPFMVGVAEGLAARGVEVVTFNFLYTEEQRKAPDRPAALIACWRAVLERFADKNITTFMGGKSMGGRIASMVAAEGVEGIAGLVFLGYPLHPPKRPAQRRDAHLPRIEVPMLFVQGERDPFGAREELTELVAKLPRAELYVVAGGDHSLQIPKRAGRQPDVDAAVQQKIAGWMR